MQEHVLEQLWWRNLSEPIVLYPLHHATRDGHIIPLHGGTSDLGLKNTKACHHLSSKSISHTNQKTPRRFEPLQNLPSGKSAKSGPPLRRTCMACGVKNVLVPAPSGDCTINSMYNAYTYVSNPLSARAAKNEGCF